MFELRTYTLQPQKLPEYLRLYEGRALEVLEPIRPHLVGFFATEAGALNQVVSLWRYDSFEQRMRLRGEAYRRAERLEFADFPGQIAPLLQSMESKLLVAAPFSPLK
jgi:hypothetical protein